MPEADFDADIAKMEKIAAVVAKFDNPDVQALAYATLAAQAFGTPLPSREPAVQGTDPAALADVVDLDAETDEDGDSPPAKKAVKKAVKKAGKKLVYSATKNINFAPSGKTSWKDFAAEKNPTNNFEKALVAVHYMREILGRTVATGDVIAAFDLVKWKNPTDPANNLQQAGSKGWLDTSNMNDVKTVWAGENYLKHDLPKAAKSKK